MNQHIIPKKDKWGVRSEGKSRVSRVFETKEEAISYAKTLAKKHKACAYIHKKDAIIHNVHCYI